MTWFNWGAPAFRVAGRRIVLWNGFNRLSTQGHWWGLGVLQIGNRHLLYVGDCGVRALFVGKTP